MVHEIDGVISLRSPHRRPRSVVALTAGPLLAAHGALLALYDLGRWPFLTLGVVTFAFAAYVWAARRFEHEDRGGTLLWVAALLRLLLLPLPPTLSDDVLRYGWDGKVVNAGYNPYLLAPDSPELGALRDDRWRRMPHKEVPTVYPPLALLTFSIASRLSASDLGIKILLTLAELAACWLLVRLARSHGLPAGRAVWYCWNPLVTLEVAGMGHVDGLLVLGQVAAVLLLARRPWAAGAAAASAVLAKIVPLVAVPMWARQSRHPAAFLLACLGILMAAALPVAAAAGGIPPGLIKYGVAWEFNGPLYEPLWRLYDQLELSRVVKSGLDELKQSTGRHELWNNFYPFVYPQLLAKLTLLGVFAGAALMSLRETRPIAGTGRLLGWVLLCSATMYPWYLLWVLPWAALGKHRGWLALSGLIQLSYLPQLTSIPLFPWIYLAIWVPFGLLLAASRWSIA